MMISGVGGRENRSRVPRISTSKNSRGQAAEYRHLAHRGQLNIISKCWREILKYRRHQTGIFGRASRNRHNRQSVAARR